MTVLHSVLSRLFFEDGNFDPFEVDVRFEAPTPDWTERLTRPTINLFLYDMQENRDLRQTSFRASRSAAEIDRRLAARRVDLSYLVSVVAADPSDEHLLLWMALRTVLRNSELPAELLPEAVQELETPVSLRIAAPEERASGLELWSALGSRPRPAVNLIVTAPMDLGITFTDPLVLTRTTRYLRGGDDDSSVTNIGGFVQDKAGLPVAGAEIQAEGKGQPVVADQNGLFRLARVPTGEIKLRVSRPGGKAQRRTIAVPSRSYVVTID